MSFFLKRKRFYISSLSSHFLWKSTPFLFLSWPTKMSTQKCYHCWCEQCGPQASCLIECLWLFCDRLPHFNLMLSLYAYQACLLPLILIAWVLFLCIYAALQYDKYHLSTNPCFPWCATQLKILCIILRRNHCVRSHKMISNVNVPVFNSEKNLPIE